MTWVCRIPNCPQYGVEQTAGRPQAGMAQSLGAQPPREAAMTATVYICGGTYAYERRIVRCPKEKRRRRFVVGYGSPYYPPMWHCLGCGIVIEPGEGYHRLRTDTARRKAITKARALWDATPSGRVQFDDDHYPMRRA